MPPVWTVVWILLAVAGAAWAHGPRDHPKSHFRLERLSVQLDPEVTLTTSSNEFNQQRQVIEVQWSGLQNPGRDDVLAVYVPHTASPWHTLPVQWVNCSAADPDHLITGRGSARLVLLNLRSNFRFALIKGGPVHPQLVAQSEPVVNKIRYQPTGGHLALHADQRSVVVQWVSASHFPQLVQWQEADQMHHAVSSSSSGLGVGSSSPWGAADPPINWRWTGTSTFKTYKASQMCGFPANASGWIHPGFIHSALIPARTLHPGQRYIYRYGADGPGAGWSEPASFIAPLGPGVSSLRRKRAPTAPAASAAGASVARALKQYAQPLQEQHQEEQQQQQQQPGTARKEEVEDEEEEPFVFLAFNDVAQTNPLLFNDPWRGGLHFAADYGENSTHLMQHLVVRRAEANAHLALMVGDLAYAMGYGADWDMFADQFEAAFRQWPMAVGTGNHEADWPGTDAFHGTARDSGGECNVPFMHRWYTPANAKGNPRASFYAFSQGPVAFLVLDSESPSDPDSPQGRFVASALGAVDRQVTPWLVVAMHRMMVAPATWRRKWVGDVDNMERLQADYQELFRSYQVDVVIQGHEHAYARTCPMYKGVCVTPEDASDAPAVEQPHATSTSTSAVQEQRWDATSSQHAQPAGQSWMTATWQRLRTTWVRAVSWLVAGRQPATSSQQQQQQQQQQHKEAQWQQQQQQQQLKPVQQQQQLEEEDEGAAGEAHHQDAPSGGSSTAESRGRILSGRRRVRHTFKSPAGGPVYMLAGHAGAGFTYGFPGVLPDWVEAGAQGVNGLLRFTATSRTLLMEAVVAENGTVMDHLQLTRT